MYDRESNRLRSWDSVGERTGDDDAVMVVIHGVEVRAITPMRDITDQQGLNQGVDRDHGIPPFIQ
jgi:hypothetical protein